MSSELQVHPNVAAACERKGLYQRSPCWRIRLLGMVGTGEFETSASKTPLWYIIRDM
ncbi:hypothetical protein Mapa_006109 [Marchantia paleacea]|nr:hypothetical protein Mapa_006109 [Marchantia paleacea]